MADRVCPRCDRPDCPLLDETPKDRARAIEGVRSDREPRLHEAAEDCAANAVDWRKRALAAEEGWDAALAEVATACQKQIDYLKGQVAELTALANQLGEERPAPTNPALLCTHLDQLTIPQLAHAVTTGQLTLTEAQVEMRRREGK